MTKTLTKDQKTRLVNIIIKRMERLIKRGVYISTVGTGIHISDGAYKTDNIYSVCALGVLLVGVKAESKKEDAITDVLEDKSRWDLTGLVEKYQLDRTVFLGIECGFMDLSSSEHVNYNKDGYEIGQRVRAIALKREWIMW